MNAKQCASDYLTIIPVLINMTQRKIDQDNFEYEFEKICSGFMEH